MFSLETSIIALKSSINLTPPASGVPVPGNSDGSKTSKSIVKYTGFPFKASQASLNPVSYTHLRAHET